MNPQIELSLTNFFKAYKPLSFRKNEILFRPGDSFQNIMFVRSGYIRLFLTTSEGREITLNIFKPAFYFSFMFGVIDESNKYYFEALTPIEAWSAPRTAFVEFLKKNPEIMFELTKNISRGFKDLLLGYEALTSPDAYSKIASTIYVLSNRFGVKKNDNVEFELKFSHQELAGFTGLTRETVSKQMERLEKEGRIEIKKRLIIVKNFTDFENSLMLN